VQDRRHFVRRRRQIREDRLAQEVVMMVEKGDIAEELTRLTHHVEQMEKAIDGREPSGKKLDFMTQEMLREVNTMGSKSRRGHPDRCCRLENGGRAHPRAGPECRVTFHPDGTLFIISGPSGRGKRRSSTR
jgi:hypothetical protein